MDYQHKTNGNRYILVDTSISSPNEETSLPERLYHGIRGLSMIDDDMINQRMSKLGELNVLLESDNVFVIEEVVDEMSALLKIVNQQQNFINHSIGKKNRNRHVKIRPETDMPTFTQHDLVEKIRAYTHELYRVIRRLNNRDPRNHFTPLQTATYKTFLDIARTYSADLFRESVYNALKKRHSQMLGIGLETDQKIISTACTLAYNKSVTIYTRDADLPKLFGRVTENLSNTSQRREFGLTHLPENPLRFSNNDIPANTIEIRFHYSPRAHEYVDKSSFPDLSKYPQVV